MQQPPPSGMPPPPGQGWPSAPGAGGPPPFARGPVQRPGAVTAAAVLLIVSGSLVVLFGLLIVIAGAVVSGSRDIGPFNNVGAAVIVVGVLALAYGGFEIASGVRVLALRNGWRVAGIVFASIGVLFSALSTIGSFSSEDRTTFDNGSLAIHHGANPGGIVFGLIFLGAYLFILVVLARNGRYFQGPTSYGQWPPPQQPPPGQFTA